MWNRPIPLKAALWFITYLYLNHINLTIFHNTLYTLKKGWTWFAQYALWTNKLPAVFQSLSSSVIIPLGVTHPSSLATAVIHVESVAPGMSSTDVMVAEKLHASSHAPYMTYAVHVRKRENSRTFARSPKTSRMKTATKPVIADFKKHDMLDVR